MKKDYLAKIREGEELSLKDQTSLVFQLSIPAILANAASTIMGWIDSAMVGRLGSNEAASIAIVMSCMWLIHGVAVSAAAGFSVMVAQNIGAKREREARRILNQGYIISVGFGCLLAVIGCLVARQVPVWLKGDPSLVGDAGDYFFIACAALPVVSIGAIAEGMLRSSGDMKTPSMIFSGMCILDMLFNYLLIFPDREVFGITIPGAGLGVKGAALGTLFAEIIAGFFFMYFLFIKSPMLHLRKGEKLVFEGDTIAKCLRISVPVAVQSCVMTGAQVMCTRFIAPLGATALAAHSFANTSEGICYMPGFGIQSAASTMIGQSVGAKRKDLAYKIGWVNIALGSGIMAVMAVVGFVFAKPIMGVFTTDAEVIALGAKVLRIEMLAEPLFGASIVCGGIFQGAGDATATTILNIASIWGIRVTLTAILAGRVGLAGVWIAMAVELSIRGIIFIIRMVSKRWLNKSQI